MTNIPSKQEEELWKAALNDDEGLIKASKVDINAKTPLGNTALHIAASGGCLSAVKALLDKGADIDCLDSDGLTPLFKAVKGGKADIAHHLLDRGASTFIEDCEGTKIIHYASLNGMTTLVQHLLKHDKNWALVRDDSDQLPIHKASEGGHVDIVRQLLSCEGSHVNVVSSENMYTPLHEAAFWGKKTVVRHLLDNHASVNLKNRLNETPIKLAKILGHTHVAELIRSKGGILEEVTS